jgi:hypothetical protein
VNSEQRRQADVDVHVGRLGLDRVAQDVLEHAHGLFPCRRLRRRRTSR